MPNLTIAEIDNIISASPQIIGYYWDNSHHSIACTLKYHRQEHPARNEYGWPNYDSNGVDSFARDWYDDPVQQVLEGVISQATIDEIAIDCSDCQGDGVFKWVF